MDRGEKIKRQDTRGLGSAKIIPSNKGMMKKKDPTWSILNQEYSFQCVIHQQGDGIIFCFLNPVGSSGFDTPERETSRIVPGLLICKNSLATYSTQSKSLLIASHYIIKIMTAKGLSDVS